MTHALPIDEPSVLLFNDAFGLTRLVLPKKVKTVRNFVSGLSWSIQPVLEGPTPRVGVSGSNSSKLLALPDLKAAGAIRYVLCRNYAFAPDGSSLYRFDGGVGQDGMMWAFIYRFPIGEVNERNIVQRKRFLIGKPLKLEMEVQRFTLGEGGTGLLPPVRRVWKDQRFVACDGRRIWGGKLKKSSVDIGWYLEVQQGLLRASMRVVTDDEGIWFSGQTPDRQEGVILHISREGAVRHWRFPALETPAYHNGTVGLRTDLRTIERFPLDNPEQRERFTLPDAIFELEGGLDPADVKAAPEITIEAITEGPGQVLIHGDQLFYLPWHGETLWNATAKKARDQTIPRKLTAKELDLRSFASRLSARLGAAAAALGGDVRLRGCSLAPKKPISIGWDSSEPEGEGFGRLCFQAMMNAPLRAYDLSAIGRVPNSQRGYRGGTSTPWTVEEVQEGLRTLETFGIPLKTLARPLNAGFHNDNEQAPKPAFAEGAAALVAGAILASACGRSERPAVRRLDDALAQLDAGLIGEDPRTWEGNALYRDTLTRLLS